LCGTQATKVDTQDIERVYELFVDVERSREYLASSSSHEYISSEVAMEVEKAQ
jgi:DNA helicase TIP49 (TBP-interacting protein)